MLIVLAGATTLAARAMTRGIIGVTGDVYRFRNSPHTPRFVITGAGVVVTDPITCLINGRGQGNHALRGAGDGEVTNMIMQAHVPANIYLAEALK